MTIYNKLIRDKIPEIIKNNNKQCEIKKLSVREYKQSLKNKLLEEVYEVLEANNTKDLIDEIADVYEVLSAIIQVYELSEEEIKEVQKEKGEKRGIFDKKIQLISVYENNIIEQDLNKNINIEKDLHNYLYKNIDQKIANNLDHNSDLLKQAFSAIANENPLWLSLKLPVEWGGLQVSKRDFFTSKMMMAKYSGALAFFTSTTSNSGRNIIFI